MYNGRGGGTWQKQMIQVFNSFQELGVSEVQIEDQTTKIGDGRKEIPPKGHG